MIFITTWTTTNNFDLLTLCEKLQILNCMSCYYVKSFTVKSYILLSLFNKGNPQTISSHQLCFSFSQVTVFRAMELMLIPLFLLPPKLPPPF